MKNYIKSIKNDVINCRRTIHQNPELSYEEKETSNYIANELDKLGITYKRQSDNYGIIAYFNVDNASKTIAFRADMDALPLNEETNVNYSSKKSKCMHACGHDAHTAILLGFAKVLQEFKSELKNNIILVFQPAEEASPNGGAKAIINSGVLDGIDEIYGLHVWPEANVGEVMVKKGAMMANSDHFYVSINGKSSHAAEPHKGIDALSAACNWVSNIQTFISRGLDPFDNAVLTIGTFNSGVRYNVVSELTKIEGTCRTFSSKTRDYLENSLKNSLEALDKAYGTNSVLDYQRGYPALINNDEAVDKVIKAIIKSDLKVVYKDNASTGAEDFAFYLQKYKGAFFFLGTKYSGCFPLHHPKFNIDEDILLNGILVFTNLAFNNTNDD